MKFSFFTLVIFVLFTQGRAAAQTSQLTDYIRQTLSMNQQVRIQQQQIALRLAQVRTATAPFNLQLNSQVTRNRSLEAFSPLEKLQLNTPDNYHSVNLISYSLSAAKRFKTGQVLSAEMGMNSLNLSYAKGTDYNGGLRFVFTQPLMFGAGKTFQTAPLESARLLLESETQQLRFIASQQVRTTVVAYLNYIAYHEIVDTLAVAQHRYEQLLRDIEELVKAHKIKPADLIPIRANLADQVRSRLAAERELNNARRNLALAIGYSWQQAEKLPKPFANLSSGHMTSDTLPDGSYYGFFLENALTRRPDYQALTKTMQAAQISFTGAEKAIKPRLDLSVNVGYNGYEYRNRVDEQSLRYLVGPLYNNVFGLNAGVTLSFQMAPQFDQAQGNMLSADALYQQAVLREEQLRNSIQTNVQMLYQNLALSTQELIKARESVNYFKTTIENEQIKLTLGSSTIINLLQSHTSLATATVNEINARLHYLTTIVEFRFATGQLIQVADEANEVDVNSIFTLPRME